MKRKAFGAIDLLIGLVITSILFIVMTSAMKGVSSLKLKGNKVNQESVQQHVDETVNEIENMRQQTIDYSKNVENY